MIATHREVAQNIRNRFINSRKIKITASSAKIYTYIAVDLLIETNASPGAGYWQDIRSQIDTI
jgi:hypothetical protein